MQSAKESMAVIRKMATMKGVSVNKLLVDCGLGKNLIYDAERNNSFPTADKIVLIAAYLGVSTDYLLGIENADENMNEPPETALGKEPANATDVQSASIPPGKVSLAVVGKGGERENHYVSEKAWEHVKGILEELDK